MSDEELGASEGSSNGLTSTATASSRGTTFVTPWASRPSMAHAGPGALRAMFDAVDGDGDGLVHFADFALMEARKRQVASQRRRRRQRLSSRPARRARLPRRRPRRRQRRRAKHRRQRWRRTASASAASQELFSYLTVSRRRDCPHERYRPRHLRHRRSRSRSRSRCSSSSRAPSKGAAQFSGLWTPWLLRRRRLPLRARFSSGQRQQEARWRGALSTRQGQPSCPR